MHRIFTLLCLLTIVLSLDNGLAKTPPLIYSTFDRGCNFNEDYIRAQVNLLISTGLAVRGYRTVILDDCWQLDRDESTKQLREDPNKFPSGLQNLIDFIHSKGLMIGLNTDIGPITRSGRPGSLNYEQTDVATLAKWGVDVIKIDNSQNITSIARQSFMLMSQYILRTGNNIVVMVDNDGKQGVESWAGKIANVWRTAPEIKATWQSVTTTLDQQYGFEVYSGEGAWNDPGYIKFDLPLNQFTVQFVLWTGLKAPLAIQSPIDTISSQKLLLLLNEQLIGINQDKLKKQMRLVRREQFQKGCQQIWGGPLSENRYLLIFFNQMTVTSAMEVSLTKQVRLTQITPFSIRDPVNRVNMGSSSSDTFTVPKILGHSVEARILNF